MASTRRRYAVEATGVKRVQQQLRSLGLGDALPEALRPVHREVSNVVATAAKSMAPRRSGRLAGAVTAVDDPKDRWPLVRVGSRGEVPYGGPIHFGWPTRGLYRASSAVIGQSRILIESGQASGGYGLRAQGKIERRRARVKKGKSGKQLPRGGPIKPNLFLYEAADRRRGEILEAYQDGVNRIFTAAINAEGR